MQHELPRQPGRPQLRLDRPPLPPPPGCQHDHAAAATQRAGPARAAAHRRPGAPKRKRARRAAKQGVLLAQQLGEAVEALVATARRVDVEVRGAWASTSC
jgi:hypothetical protein